MVTLTGMGSSSYTLSSTWLQGIWTYGQEAIERELKKLPLELLRIVIQSAQLLRSSTQSRPLQQWETASSALQVTGCGDDSLTP